jgi:exodeoxyribonuclease VII small subunit
MNENNNKIDFEEQLQLLEDIVDILDSGNETLEVLLANFEKGMQISCSLRDYLNNAEQKVIDITKINENNEE